jgi:3-oxoacyl-[acyl-carrier-protein] synthase-3
MQSVGIDALECSLPDCVVTNGDLAAENPSWQMESVAARAGVFSRHVAAEGETALDLATRACEAIRQSGRLEEIDGIVFCTQTPDYVMPSNAFLLQERLGLKDRILAFDFNLACSGFVYGLAICRGLILGRQARRLLLVNADTYTRLINPGDRSARVLFGDGAAATVVSAETTRLRLIDFELWSSGRSWRKFWVPAGGFRQPKCGESKRIEIDASGNRRTPEDIHMDGMGVWKYINSAVPEQVDSLLSRNNLTRSDVDLFVFHQASAMTLDSLERRMGIPRERSFRNLETVGNIVSASIPAALSRAIREGRIKSGMRILAAGFGVGLSAGSVLMEA